MTVLGVFLAGMHSWPLVAPVSIFSVAMTALRPYACLAHGVHSFTMFAFPSIFFHHNQEGIICLPGKKRGQPTNFSVT